MEIKEEYVGKKIDVGNIKSAWWNLPEGQAHESIFAVVNKIKTTQSYRFMQYLRYARAYSDLDMLGFPFGVVGRAGVDQGPTNRITYNIVKSCVDTVSSKIAKNKPRPIFLTQDGNYKQQTKAKQLTKYLDGAFDIANVYPLAQKMFVDACVFGIGALKVYVDPDTKKIAVDRVIPIELIIDDGEAVYGEPRQVHQEKYISRDVLLGLFPKASQEILSVETGFKGNINNYTSADMVTVIESWYLKPNAETKGKHCITISNKTLFEEDYDKDYFPFVFFRWTDKLTGFYGTGLAEELQGIQLEINKVMRVIQQAHSFMSNPKVLVEATSDINTNHINDMIGAIIKYVGTPPQFISPPVLSPEVYAYLESLIRKGFEITGVSMLSATSKKPSGLDSGVALREFQDIESERFMLAGMRYEKLFLDLARIFIDQSKDLYEMFPDLAVKVNLGNGLTRIKWKDVAIDEDQYVSRLFPTSMLPTQPAARMQKVQEYIQAGWMDTESAMELLDFPDDTAFTNPRTASNKIIKKLVFAMLDDGKYAPPEPYFDLQKAKSMTQLYYLEARSNDAPDDRLELLRRFIADCEALQEQEMMTQQAQAMPLQGAPIANPEQLPTSDLLPQI
jgi:hypothetical protein